MTRRFQVGDRVVAAPHLRDLYPQGVWTGVVTGLRPDHDRVQVRRDGSGGADGHWSRSDAWELDPRDLPTLVRDTVAAVLARIGLEVHGEMRGLLQEIGHPESASGFDVILGNGLPLDWKR